MEPEKQNLNSTNCRLSCTGCCCTKVRPKMPENQHNQFPSLPLYNTSLNFKKKPALEDISSTIQKIPYFVLSVSFLEILFYYAATDELKRLLIYDANSEREVWRFVTYMLVHTDPVHLGLNVIVQGFLGAPLELEQGRVRCAVIYLGGGLGGSLTASLFPELSLMAGASAGIYALLLSQIPNAILNTGSIRYASYRIAAVAVLVASDLAYVCYHVHFCKNENPKIGWVAHVSGAAMGFLLGFSIFKGTCQWRRKSQILSSILLVSIFVAILARVAYPGLIGAVFGDS